MDKKDEKPLNDKLNDMISSGMRKTERWVSMWQESLRYFFSDQLHGQRKRKNWEWVVVNYLWPSAMQEIAKLIRNDPKILARPVSDDDNELAETWQHALDYKWQNGLSYRKDGTGMRLDTIAMLLDLKLYGYCVSKVFWDDFVDYDDEKNEDIGDVMHLLWHPAHFWADDDEFIQRGNCGTRRYIRLEDAKKQWPEFANELEAEAVDYKQTGGAFDSIRGQYAVGTAGTVSEGLGGKDKGVERGTLTNMLLNLVLGSDKIEGQHKDIEIRVVPIDEIYFKDYTKRTETIEEPISEEELRQIGLITNMDGLYVDAEGNEITEWPTRTRKITRRVFPRGRHIIRVGKSTILNPKEEDQVYKYKIWPFISIPHYLLPHMWQGMDAVQMFKSAQDMINVSASHLLNNLKMFGDPKVAVEDGAISTPHGRSDKQYKVGAGAGSIIRLVRGGLARFKIMDPPNISAGALQLYQMHAQEFKNITGLQSIAKGEKMPGKMTATESQVLAISSNDRISLQSKYLDVWIVGVAQMTAYIMADMYEPGRLIRIVGEDKIQGVQEFTQGMKDLDFDLDIVRGSTLPFDEEKHLAKLMQGYQLLTQPANPLLPQILRELEIPNWRKILEQHEPYQQYLMLLQLYDAVKSGEVEPQQAVQMILQQVVKIAQERGDNLNPNEGKKNAVR